MTLWGALLLIAVIAGFLWLVWYLLIETEGVYLGQRVVVWLYDLYAWHYDEVKEFDDISDHLILAQPLMRRLRTHVHPFVLDVGTGTARLPLALCQHSSFEGYIVALDMSLPMLKQAQAKIEREHFTEYVQFVRANGQVLPYDDGQFDVVTCLEAIEFMPNPEQALREQVRVLRDGGWLVITNRQAITMPGRIWQEDELEALLATWGMIHIAIDVWQEDYKLVWAQKSGKVAPVGVHMPEEITYCPDCQEKDFRVVENGWQCGNCHYLVRDKSGIIDLIAGKISIPNKTPH